MLILSGKKIIRIVVFWHILKVIGYGLLIGVSMACSDGVRCSMYPSEFIVIIAPMFAYLIGGIISIWEQRKRVSLKAINKALSITFFSHLAWSFLIYPFFVIKFYNLNQNTIYFIVFPIILLCMIIYIWLKNR